MYQWFVHGGVLVGYTAMQYLLQHIEGVLAPWALTVTTHRPYSRSVVHPWLRLCYTDAPMG